MRLKKFLLFEFDQWALVLVAAALPWNIPVGNAVLIATVILGFLLAAYKKDWSWFSGQRVLIPVLAFFLLIVLSALTSSNIDQGLKQIDKALLLPMIAFAVLRFHRYTRLEVLAKAMTYSSAIAVSVLLLIASIRFLSGGGTEVFFFHSFTEPIGQHAVYFSLTALLSILFYAEFSRPFQKGKREVRNFILLFLLLLLGIVLSASKVVIAMTIILLPLYSFGARMNNKAKAFTLSAVVGLFVLGLVLTPVRKRFMEGLALRNESVKPAVKIADTYEYTLEEVGEISDLEVRFIFVKIGAFHWWHSKELVWGFGIGDIQDQLNYYYYVYGLAKGGYLNFNLHNQFLQTLVGMGIVGLCALLWIFWISFRSGVQFGNKAHVFFLVIMTLVFLLECVLSRNKGILLFFFLNTIFLLKNSTLESSYPRDQGNSE